MGVKKIETVIIDNGVKKEIFLFPDETRHWIAIANALGGIVFNQLMEIKNTGEVTVKMGHVFKMVIDGEERIHGGTIAG